MFFIPNSLLNAEPHEDKSFQGKKACLPALESEQKDTEEQWEDTVLTEARGRRRSHLTCLHMTLHGFVSLFTFLLF